MLDRWLWFSIENTTAAPDGVEIPVQLINGSFPGPTIVADWGDTVCRSSICPNVLDSPIRVMLPLFVCPNHVRLKQVNFYILVVHLTNSL